MTRPRLLETLLAEVIYYGGMPLTRHDVYTLALEDTGSARGADFFAFHPQAVDAEPITIDAMRQICGR